MGSRLRCHGPIQIKSYRSQRCLLLLLPYIERSPACPYISNHHPIPAHSILILFGMMLIVLFSFAHDSSLSLVCNSVFRPTRHCRTYIYIHILEMPPRPRTRARPAGSEKRNIVIGQVVARGNGTVR